MSSRLPFDTRRGRNLAHYPRLRVAVVAHVAWGWATAKPAWIKDVASVAHVAPEKWQAKTQSGQRPI